MLHLMLYLIKIVKIFIKIPKSLIQMIIFLKIAFHFICHI